jgi:carbonic anhydrase
MNPDQGDNLMWTRHRLFVLALALAITACANHEGSTRSVAASPLAAPMTQASQAAMTPDLALQRLKDGNERFVAGKGIMRNFPSQVAATGTGQFPYATVLSCIDSRAAPELVFDQGIGDIFSPRVAGNFVNEDILGSMEFGSKVAGSRLIVVLGHSSCGAIKGACDNVQLGYVSALVKALQPAVDAVADDGSERSSKNAAFVEKVAHANVEITVKEILSRSEILRDMAAKGQIRVVGAMLDVGTGKVTFME